MYLCQICKQYARVSLKEIIRHIRDMHRHFSTPVRCGVEGCTSTATSYDSLRQHTYKKHRSKLIPEELDHINSVTSFEEEACNVEPESLACTSTFTGEESHDVALASSDSSTATTQSMLEAARFILKLRDGKGLPQTVTDSIIKDIQAVIDSTTDNLKNKVVQYLVDVNKLSHSEITQIQEMFSSENAIFDGLESVQNIFRNILIMWYEKYNYFVLTALLEYACKLFLFSIATTRKYSCKRLPPYS